MNDKPQINKPKNTRALNLPLTKFAKPTRQSQSGSDSQTQVVLEFSNGRLIHVDLYTTAVLGRHMDDTGDMTKIDLSQTGDLDNGISRSHALLHMIDGVVFVTDDNSLNGTYLNGAELYPMRNYMLNDGDTLKLGNVELRVQFTSNT
jgi:pSer/pThr/pTyr-binding forkhead associated (FHA) protein